MVESIIMLRSDGDEVNGFAPRQADLQPYIDISGANGYPFRWEDVTARINANQVIEPRAVIIRARMHNQAALAMSSDTKLWMIASQRFADDEEGELVEDNYDELYTAQERTTRINQLSNFTDFDSVTISTWWTTDKTRREVGVKLRNYLRTLVA